jgi:hypothetical protein
MKPTLFRMLQGYLPTAFATVATRFALEENKTVSLVSIDIYD